MKITDYCLLDKEIIVNKDEGIVSLGKKKERKKIISIEELKERGENVNV